MSDFPAGYVNPNLTSVSSYGRQSLAATIIYLFTTSSGAAWGLGINGAIYIPFYLEQGRLAQKMGVQVMTQSGNLDVGIYNESGTKLVSSGSTAVAAAGLQVLDIADTVLNPGTYYMAMAVDNVTAAFKRTSLTAPMGRVCGVRQQASAFALPSTATFAVYAATYVPWLAVQFASVL